MQKRIDLPRAFSEDDFFVYFGCDFCGMDKAIVRKAVKHTDVEGNGILSACAQGKARGIRHVHIVASTVAREKNCVNRFIRKRCKDSLAITF